MAAPYENGMRSSASSPGFGIHCTSFQKKTRSKLVSISGTKHSLQNGLLLISTGIPSLDYVLEEDKYNSFSFLFLKYFLAEGVVCGHNLFVASASKHPGDILQDLPAPIVDDVDKIEMQEEVKIDSKKLEEPMTIAWRYQNLPKMQTSVSSSLRFGHYYDVSKQMAPLMVQSAKCHKFFLPDEVCLVSSEMPSNMNAGYRQLLLSIQRVIQEEGFDGACPQNKQRNILRIGIHSLGSPLWGDDICCSDNPQHVHSFTKFLYGLRSLLRTSLSACIVTVPAHLIQNKVVMARIMLLSDTVVGLESFVGSKLETSPLYKDYHGLLHVSKIPHLNSLVCNVPDNKDLAFKLKRKLLTIEKLHLPPDLSDTVRRSGKQDLAEPTKSLSFGCPTTAVSKKHLDF
ncbi:elongator complex protein 4 isoform X2 [Protopterus annectens]|uniref:elongator complex protein 4 isoform X2 n=1 Tax=Protopterus annectens TaxID=7888 RepID=UPI001CF9D57C|nr:elongator complex protein 4 isoform X2 [Protopterus annectens]